MADEQAPQTDGSEIPDAPPSPASMNDFGQMMAAAIASGISQTQRRKVTAGEFDPKTPWQPDKRLTLTMNRPAFQNGYRMDPAKLTNKEIALLNRIKRSGRYINRVVEAVVRSEGSEEVVELRYANKTADQRFENKGLWRDLEDMLRQIVTEQDEIEAASKPAKAPHVSFMSKNTREALEARAAREA